MVIKLNRNVLILTSIVSSTSTYHQVRKIHKQRNAKNISVLNVSSVWTNMCANLIYAYSIKDIRLMVTFGNSLLSVSTFLGSVMYFNYINSKKVKELNIS